MKNDSPLRKSRRHDTAPGMDRREFVARGSVAVLSPWLLGGVAGARYGVRDGENRPLVVGYLRGSERLADSLDLMRAFDAPGNGLLESVLRRREEVGSVEPLEIIPAHYLPAGDADLAAGSPRLWIHGLLPPGDGHGPSRLVSAALDVVFPEVDARAAGDKRFVARYPFHAWQVAREPTLTEGYPIAFPVVVNHRADLRLSVEALWMEEGAASDRGTPLLMSADVTLGGEPGRAKLREGIYLLGLDPDVGSRLPLTANHEFLVPEGTAFLVMSVHSARTSATLAIE